MSLTSRIIFGVGLALVLLACCVDAHGWMSYPSPRGQYASPKKYAYQEIAPATTNPDDANFVCRSDPEMPRANWLPLTAGKAQTINLEITAKHVGDCFVYLTYDGDKPITEMKWFKIWEQHACRDKSTYEVPIPSYLPSGEHVIFRWEWYALHVHPTVEFYAQCVDATLSGATSGALPQPQVTMPGHLPKSSGSTADGTNTYWYPFGDQPMFFTGPPVATLNGQPNPTIAPSAPTSAPPVAPTQRPVTPTEAPPVAPTQRPVTPAPTAAATVAPVATQAPVVTQAPVATQAPVTPTSAPTLSVKLNVLSASAWYFQASIAGHRANEVVKVEVKDSKNFVNFTPIDLNWVWEFSPSAELVYPLTVRASLASGSSLSFIVNGPRSTTVDSGYVFP